VNSQRQEQKFEDVFSSLSFIQKQRTIAVPILLAQYSIRDTKENANHGKKIYPIVTDSPINCSAQSGNGNTFRTG
jgi:hypothetical protein